MTNQTSDKDTKGRSWDQLTDGSTSAATMGAGATGDVGASAERRDSAQQSGRGALQRDGADSAGRTDDLLAGGSNEEQSDKGFREKSGAVQGNQPAAGNRQSADQARQGASETDDDQYDQGTART